VSDCALRGHREGGGRVTKPRGDDCDRHGLKVHQGRAGVPRIMQASGAISSSVS
jgi:hypothetical protein